MKKIFLIILAFTALCLYSNYAPVVTIVGVQQRDDGSYMVDISYNLSDADLMLVSIAASNDGSLSWDYEINSVTGDIGYNIASGTGKQITWDFAADHPDVFEIPTMVKITANDLYDTLVGGGTFNNGTSDVTVSSFYLGKYEVTQSEYEAVMGNNPSTFTDVTNGPVEKVSWFDAIEYCNRRSMDEGLTSCYSYSSYGTYPDDWPVGWNSNYFNAANVSCSWTADGYRLPTEAEWHFAARGGNDTQNYAYSGSNTIGDVAWYISNSVKTHTVGTKASNELGTYDMSGNVREWVWDRWAASYLGGAQTNPHGPESGDYRVGRGGSWCNSADNCTVSSRFYSGATYSNYYIGFRLCRISP